MNIAVVGSRNYQDLRSVVSYVKSLNNTSIIVSGGANGPDSIAVKVANKYKLQTLVFLPDWDKYGRSAGIIRNTKIVDACDMLVAFWDLTSRGTADSIKKALDRNKPVTIFTIVSEDVKINPMSYINGSLGVNLDHLSINSEKLRNIHKYSIGDLVMVSVEDSKHFNKIGKIISREVTVEFDIDPQTLEITKAKFVPVYNIDINERAIRPVTGIAGGGALGSIWSTQDWCKFKEYELEIAFTV